MQQQLDADDTEYTCSMFVFKVLLDWIDADSERRSSLHLHTSLFRFTTHLSPCTASCSDRSKQRFPRGWTINTIWCRRTAAEPHEWGKCGKIWGVFETSGRNTIWNVAQWKRRPKGRMSRGGCRWKWSPSLRGRQRRSVWWRWEVWCERFVEARRPVRKWLQGSGGFVSKPKHHFTPSFFCRKSLIDHRTSSLCLNAACINNQTYLESIQNVTGPEIYHQATSL